MIRRPPSPRTALGFLGRSPHAIPSCIGGHGRSRHHARPCADNEPWSDPRWTSTDKWFAILVGVVIGGWNSRGHTSIWPELRLRSRVVLQTCSRAADVDGRNITSDASGVDVEISRRSW